MINQKQAIKIYRQFLKDVLGNENWYKNVSSHIKASLLYGSVAKGTNREDSDIDILLILPLEIEEKFTNGEYVYNYQSHEVNIVLRSIEKLRKIAQEQKDSYQKEVFRDSTIISACDDEVKNLLLNIQRI